MGGLLLSMQGAVSQGVLWGIMVLGVYITFRILDVADMTVDGSFATGACVCAALIVNAGWNPLSATLVAILAGALAGVISGTLHAFFEIPAVLAGILTQLGLWSINLRIMDNKPNISMLNEDSIFSWLVKVTGWKQSLVALVLGIVIVIIVIFVLYWFFGTEAGAALRATGDNEDMVRALGASTRVSKILGLTISNALVGFSGALVCQSQKYADVSIGIGAIVIGLAAIVIGEKILLGRIRSFGGKMTSVVLGSVVYFMIRAAALQLGMKANDMKLISAIIVILALTIPVIWKKWKVWRSYSEGGNL